MPSTTTAKRYFDALRDRDLDAAVACWAPGGVDRIADQDLIAPDGVRGYFTALFAAFPDFALQRTHVMGSGQSVAVRWRATGTFAGPGSFEGFEPNGATIAIEGCDVLCIEGDLIRSNDAFLDGADLARQLGVLPLAGSTADRRLTRLANLRTRVANALAGSSAEAIAAGVWLVRGGIPRAMNVYLLADGDGVTVFDAGIASMAPAVRRAAAQLGGIKRVVLGHADADHRGVAPALGAPVFCHAAELEAAASPSALRPYHDLSRLAPPGAAVYRRLLPLWDGGATKIEDTLAEADEVAGFRVIELPGHAPGLIGLFRERDGLALVSDTIYTIDPQTGRRGPARVPHHAFNMDTEQARASIRKLAALQPSAVWAGHADPVLGDVDSALRRAATA